MAKKLFLILVLFIFFITLYVVLLFTVLLPNDGPVPNYAVIATPDRLNRGRYLAHHVMACMDCHSERDWRYFSGPPKQDTWGQGGEVFTKEMGFPGTIYAPNITPAAIGDWTDGQLAHAIVSGTTPTGEVIFPVMPYQAYNRIAEEDLFSLIAYIRSLKPIENNVPESKINFPFTLLIKQAPLPYTPKDMPVRTNTVAYGKYLVDIAACYDCHTAYEKGKFSGEPFAGGRTFPMGNTLLKSPSITSDKTTGIGSYTREAFINRFKIYENPAALGEVPLEENTIMPWSMYAGLTRDDLGAIYDYLSTVKPVKTENN